MNILLSLLLPLTVTLSGRMAFSDPGDVVDPGPVIDFRGMFNNNRRTGGDLQGQQQQEQEPTLNFGPGGERGSFDNSENFNNNNNNNDNDKNNIKGQPSSAKPLDKGFFDFIDDLFDFGSKRRSTASPDEQGPNRPQSPILNFNENLGEPSLPSQSEQESPTNHGWFLGLAKQDANQQQGDQIVQPQDTVRTEDEAPQNNNNNNNNNNANKDANADNTPIDINNVTSRLDNWLNQILDRLDSIFSNSTPKPDASNLENTAPQPLNTETAGELFYSNNKKSGQISPDFSTPSNPDNDDSSDSDAANSDNNNNNNNKQSSSSSPISADPDLKKSALAVDSWGESFRTVTERNVPPPDEDTPEPATVSKASEPKNNEKPIIIISYEDDASDKNTDQAPKPKDEENSPQMPADKPSSSDDKDSSDDDSDSLTGSSSSATTTTADESSSTLSTEDSAEASSSQSYKNVIEISKELKVSSDESSSAGDKSGGVADPFIDPVFCRAKCMEQCMTRNGNGFPECKAVCMSSTLKDLCSNDDQPCLKACGSLPISVELNAPNVTDIKYYSKDSVVDPETVEITWNPMPEAVLYVVSIIPDSRSVESGSIMIREDFTNVPWYTFKKDDMCFTYYVRVAAVYSDGITPFSQPRFLDKAWSNGFPPIKVELGEIGVRKLMVNELSSVDFAEINLPLFSPLIFDFTKVQMSSYLLATGCPKVPPVDESSAAPASAAKIIDDDANSGGGGGGKILVRNVQFLYLPHQIILRLPVEFIPLGCNYEFRIALLRTKCGEIIPFVSKVGISFDSKIGTDFKLGCDNVQYEGCKRPMSSFVPLQTSDNAEMIKAVQAENQQEIPSSSLNRKLDETDELENSVADATADDKNQVVCNLPGFSVDVIGNPIDGFNVTLSWDAVNDGKSKTYVVRHGKVARRFVRDSATDAGVYDDDDTASEDPDLIIPDDGMSGLAQKSVKLNRPLGSTELHLVRVCVAPPTVLMHGPDWESARRYVIDMAAFPQPVLAVDPPADFMFTPAASAPPPSPPASRPSLHSNDIASRVQIAPDLTLLDSLPNWKDLPRPSDPAVTSPPSSAMQAESDAVVDRLSTAEWYRRLYMAERYADSYWFYTWAFAFLLVVLSLMVCVWASKRCRVSNNKKCHQQQQGARSCYLAKKQPMIFVTRSDSMKQPIVPNIVVEHPSQENEVKEEAETKKSMQQQQNQALPPV